MVHPSVEDIESDFAAPLGCHAKAYWVPIILLEMVQAAYRERNIKIKCRFRGPRLFDGRSKFNQQSTCTLKTATHFTVYPRES